MLFRSNYALREGSYVFDVTVDNGTVPYSGGELSFTINSFYQNASGTLNPIGWSARVLSATDWLINSDSLSNPTGGEAVNININTLPGEFSTTNAIDQTLKATTEVTTVQDLSYQDGYGYTTANCYVVNAPGWYQFPSFVMGNAILEASTLSPNNTNCFSPDQYFVDYKGNSITSISQVVLDTVGASLSVVWQDAPELVSNLSFTDNRQYIKIGRAHV